MGHKNEDFKECRNNRCSRYLVPMYTDKKYCEGRIKGKENQSCGKKLNMAWIHNDEVRANLKDEFENGGRTIMHEKFNEKKVTTISDSDTWEVKDCDLKEGCPIAPEAVVRIPEEMWNNWIYLANEFSTEWIAYMKGTEDPDNPYKVTLTECYYPKQEATSVHVQADAGEIREGTIASVHSHVGMAAFWSREDEDHMNHKVELVINRRGEFKARMRVQLKCGEYSRVDCKVVLIGKETEGNADELKKVLREKTYTYNGGGFYHASNADNYRSGRGRGHFSGDDDGYGGFYE